MGRNRLDEDELKRQAEREQIKKAEDALSAAVTARARENLALLKSAENANSQEFDQAYMHFRDIVAKRQQHLGMENVTTLILQFKPSLEAFSRLAEKHKMYMFYKIRVAIASVTTSILPVAEVAVRQQMDKWFDTEGIYRQPLPEVFVPYLAELDDNGVLSINVDVPNTQLSEEDRQTLIQTIGPNFQADVENFINGLQENGHPLFRVEDIPNVGKKIRMLPNPGAPAPAVAAPIYMTKNEFRDLRTRALTPHLQQLFGAEFRSEAENNIPRPGGP